MAIAYSTSFDDNVWNPGTTRAAPTTLDVAVGDLVVVNIMYSISSTLTIQDDASTPNVYTVSSELGDGDTNYARTAYCFITTAKTGSTITLSFGTAQDWRVTWTVAKFTKAAGETWYTDGGADYTKGWTTENITGNYTNSYSDTVSVAHVFSQNGSINWSGEQIGDVAATVIPATPANEGQHECFYRLHGAITNNHAQASSAPLGNYGSILFRSFYVTGGGGGCPTQMNHYLRQMAV